MNTSKKQRRGIVAGVSALAGVAAFAVGVAGVSQYDDVTTQQRDVALVAVEDLPSLPGYNAADLAHLALLNAQVDQNDSLFNQDVLGLQSSIYYWAEQNGNTDWLFPGSAVDPEYTLFNGAFTRASEAMLVSQAFQQVQWDHLLGVNQTFGDGGYETAIADSIHDNLLSSGITEAGTPDLWADLNTLTDSATLVSFDGFSSALTDLQGDLWSAAFSDMLGMWSL